MKLIVGLGNPGKEYAKTRHNAGFRVVDQLASKLGAGFDRSKFKGEYAQADFSQNELLLVKPQTYMNLSGETVQGFAGYFKIGLPDLLVVSDDVNLPVGALRLRRGGSDGGQKGLRDISQRMGSQEYARLRVGVGGREENAERRAENLADHVLGRFSAQEEELLKQSLAEAVDACLFWAERGSEAAMNKYNAAKKKNEDPKP